MENPPLPLKIIKINTTNPGITAKSMFRNGSSHPRSGNSIIIEIFKPIITALSLTGFCPLTLSAKKGNPQNKYVLSLKNPRTVICLVVGLLFLLGWTLFMWVFGLGKSVFGYSLPQHYSSSKFFNGSAYSDADLTSLSYVQQSNNLLIPGVLIAEVAFGWMQSRGLAKFLNNFAPLEELTFSMASSFGKSLSYPTSLFAFRKVWICFYVLLPTVLVVVFHVWAATLMNSSAFGLFIVTISCGHMLAGPLLGDVLVLLSYRVLAGFFTEIKQIITACSEDPSRVVSLCADLKRVRKLILMVRKQVELCCEWQWRRELVLIFNSVLSLTCSVYLIIVPYSHLTQELEREIGTGIKVLCVLFAICLILRGYFKGVVAETITKEEAEVAEEIINLTTKEEFGDLLLDAKLTHDMMMLSPTKISLGNYLQLNKTLSLKISSLVVTYLIVMAQFLHD